MLLRRDTHFKQHCLYIAHDTAWYDLLPHGWDWDGVCSSWRRQAVWSDCQGQHHVWFHSLPVQMYSERDCRCEVSQPVASSVHDPPNLLFFMWRLEESSLTFTCTYGMFSEHAQFTTQLIIDSSDEVWTVLCTNLCCMVFITKGKIHIYVHMTLYCLECGDQEVIWDHVRRVPQDWDWGDPWWTGTHSWCECCKYK